MSLSSELPPSFESVTTDASEFRSNRSPVIVRPARLDTWMATLLLTNSLSDTVTLWEGRSTKRRLPHSGRDRRARRSRATARDMHPAPLWPVLMEGTFGW